MFDSILFFLLQKDSSNQTTKKINFIAIIYSQEVKKYGTQVKTKTTVSIPFAFSSSSPSKPHTCNKAVKQQQLVFHTAGWIQEPCLPWMTVKYQLGLHSS